MQQRRAVRETVREEREGAAGDEEPATKSRVSSLPTVQDEKQGRRCERNGPEEWSRARSTDNSLQRTGNQRGAPGYGGHQPEVEG
ncbi:MAG TPA: hypothetical protein PLK36_05430 [Methanoregulaceae archaeon]|nr:hypothetical protein [Methanoregulaceae archaeon]HQN89499.1 hypothetical protein [Methanoregulaceae archaeon]HQP83190.1 hypothetical protein [Methanoregulaceae archaeon]